MTSTQHLFSFALLLLAVGIAGCGKSSGTVPVRGHVMYRSQPLAEAGLSFFPDTGRPVMVAANQSGEYTAELPAGEYTVTVGVGIQLPPGYKEGEPLPPPKVVLPDQYTARAKSPLKASVKAGQAEPIDFDLK